MAPSRIAHGSCVVVGEAAPVQPIDRNIVPLFAGDFAGFAADAQSGIGKEPGSPFAVLVRIFRTKLKQFGRWSSTHATLCVSRLNCSSTPALSGRRRPGIRLQTRALLSMMRTLGSSEI